VVNNSLNLYTGYLRAYDSAGRWSTAILVLRSVTVVRAAGRRGQLPLSRHLRGHLRRAALILSLYIIYTIFIIAVIVIINIARIASSTRTSFYAAEL
jgi:hypothetical protein